MNIFVLDHDTQKSAEYLCDKHAVKMILEHCQLLASTHYLSAGFRSTKEAKLVSSRVLAGFPREKPYGRGFLHHPCTQWTAASLSNYRWLCEYTKHMCSEYTYRYGKVHSCEKILDWFIANEPSGLKDVGLTEFAQAMPDDCKIPSDAVSAYRQYYVKHKLGFAKWKNRETPHFCQV